MSNLTLSQIKEFRSLLKAALLNIKQDMYRKPIEDIVEKYGLKSIDIKDFKKKTSHKKQKQEYFDEYLRRIEEMVDEHMATEIAYLFERQVYDAFNTDVSLLKADVSNTKMRTNNPLTLKANPEKLLRVPRESNGLGIFQHFFNETISSMISTLKIYRAYICHGKRFTKEKDKPHENMMNFDGVLNQYNNIIKKIF